MGNLSVAVAGFRIALLYLLTQATTTMAQTVPADLLDVSLEDLFAANVVESDTSSRRWHFAYSYGRSTFDEYRDG